MKRFSIVFTILFCLTLIMACVTVNIYFPAAEMQKAADEIVDEVHQGQKGENGGYLHKTRLQWLARLAPFLGPRRAFAQVDIDISSPAVRTLKGSLAGRFKSMKEFYSRGALGENNQGYVGIRDKSALSVKEKANLKRLVDAENGDRKALYLEILRANNLETRFLPDVEKLFANSWRNKAVSGTWIQKDDGSWVRK
jgi:uncharacterized protein YdbL (DUF1318 family)